VHLVKLMQPIFRAQRARATENNNKKLFTLTVLGAVLYFEVFQLVDSVINYFL
jgi:hypothetical protein